MKLIKRLFIFSSLFFLIQSTIIIIDGLNDEKASEKCVAAILGTKVNEDRTISERLKARLDKGIELYNDSLLSGFFVSGGLGKEGHPEGTVMAEYLISKRIPKSIITIDDLGNNTRATALNFKAAFPEEKNVYVVSQYFHITRCKIAMKQVGIENTYGAHADFFEVRDPYSILREFAGYWKYFFFY